MARNINLAVDCAECCDCPAPTLQWDSRSASKTKCGFPEFVVSTPPARYRELSYSGTLTGNPDSATASIGFSGTDYYDSSCTLVLGAHDIINGIDCDPPESFNPFFEGGTLWRQRGPDSASRDCTDEDRLGEFELESPVQTATTETWNAYPGGDTTGSVTLTLSDEYTTAQLKTNTVAALPAYDGDWNDTAGSFANLSSDELAYSIRESRYRFLFQVPLVGSGLCYRLEWVERFIPEAGAGVDSVEVLYQIPFRPNVQVASLPPGGVTPKLTAVMASDGSVSSVRILNPGSRYVVAPSLIFTSPVAPGVQAHATCSIGPLGEITSVTITVAGMYMPTLTMGGASPATLTADGMDSQGHLTGVTVVSAGLYVTNPSIQAAGCIPAGTWGFTALDYVNFLVAHLGTETARCAVWDGEIPEDYDPEDEDTWPILGDGTNPYFELAVPAADGLTTVDLVRAFCDCSDCP